MTRRPRPIGCRHFRAGTVRTPSPPNLPLKARASDRRRPRAACPPQPSASSTGATCASRPSARADVVAGVRTVPARCPRRSWRGRPCVRRAATCRSRASARRVRAAPLRPTGRSPIQLSITLRPRGEVSPKRQAEHRAQVVLELAADRAFDGPVAGVVHARRHLVAEQAPVAHEQFEREHADVIERSATARACSTAAPCSASTLGAGARLAARMPLACQFWVSG